jgi:hypothetical protein
VHTWPHWPAIAGLLNGRAVYRREAHSVAFADKVDTGEEKAMQECLGEALAIVESKARLLSLCLMHAQGNVRKRPSLARDGVRRPKS